MDPLTIAPLPAPYANTLTDRSLIRVAGSDAAPFLQGLTTKDIPVLGPDSLIYTLFLSPQGRYLYDAFVFWDNDGYCLDVHAPQAEALMAYMRKFIVRQNVTIGPVSEDFSIIATSKKIEPDDQKGRYFEDPRSSLLGYRAYTQECFSPSHGDYYDALLTLGIAEGGLGLISEKTLPFDANFDLLNALDFTKGCYIGQQLTIRVHHQGVVRKRFVPFLCQGEAPNLNADEGTLIIHRAHEGWTRGLARVNLDMLPQLVPLGFYAPKLFALLTKI